MSVREQRFENVEEIDKSGDESKLIEFVARFAVERLEHRKWACPLTEGKPVLNWLPIVDTFRTFAVCPPLAVRAVFRHFQAGAAA